MSALGQKRTSHDTLSNVRYWGLSGHKTDPPTTTFSPRFAMIRVTKRLLCAKVRISVSSVGLGHERRGVDAPSLPPARFILLEAERAWRGKRGVRKKPWFSIHLTRYCTVGFFSSRNVPFGS